MLFLRCFLATQEETETKHLFTFLRALASSSCVFVLNFGKDKGRKTTNKVLMEVRGGKRQIFIRGTVKKSVCEGEKTYL